MLFLVFHPLKHATETSIDRFGQHQDTTPSSGEHSDADDMDCIWCIVSDHSEISTDLNLNPALELSGSSPILYSNCPATAHLSAGFFLRAPPASV
jgi:hypothetical protein